MKHTITPEVIRAALACIPPDLPREEWARVGMALKAELGAAGFDLFDTWSQGSEAYNPTDARDTWRSFKSGGRVQIGTLFHIAKGFGFKWDDAPQAQPLDHAAIEAQRKARAARDQAEREETARRQTDAATKAAAQWAQATEQGHCTYLDRKGVQGLGVRFEPGDCMVIPLRDEAGKLWNLQRIKPRPDGQGHDKRFLAGGRKTGLMHWLGDPQGAGVLLLCEGWATGASLHQATGHPVCVAFDGGNLPKVGRAMRAAFPGACIVVCGDNDHEREQATGRNPGQEKATEAARAAQGLAVCPHGLPAGHTDWNDLHQLMGLDAVAAAIAKAVGEAQEAQQALQQAAQAPARAGSKGKPDTPPAGAVPPAWDRFLVNDEGVWFLEADQDGRSKAPQWVCSRLDVTARTRDEDGMGWGYLLEFTDPMGRPRTWAMPARMLAGDGAEYRAALLNMGLLIASGANARNRLTQYLQTRQPQEMARCADRVGWHGRAYVLPRETIGGDDERIVYQVDGITENPFKQRGTLEGWRQAVARLCVGNDRLLFAVACAFAGVLVRPSGVDSGGFHFRGGSSCGKTTALKVAASVWGGPAYMQRWRSTDNALEAIAAQHCDGLLILDELAQVDPKTAGECAYMLANETGKARSTRTGQARPRLSWRLLFLSAGEISLAQHMAEGGKRSKAGQELRLADIPADAGQGRGLFNQLHELASGAALSAHLGKVIEAQHGTAGRAFLEWATLHADELRTMVRGLIDRYTDEWVPEAASGQVQRVGRRFALVAAAGELATTAGVTGWPEGDAARGVRQCFDAWLQSRGGLGDAEERHMLQQVQRLLSERGAGNFAWWHRAMDDRAPNPTERWGFRRLVDSNGKPINRSSSDGAEYNRAADLVQDVDEGSQVEFYVMAEVFKGRLCEGFDHNAVAHLLMKRGHLVPEKSGRPTRKERLPGLGLSWVYRLKASVLGDDGGDV
jgi:putative DNA primase/helicase